MNNSIILTLHKAQIIESVKNETFQRGTFDKAADAKAYQVAYVEQAGDEEYHKRLLLRSLSTSLEELKSHLSDYLSTIGGSTGDNVFDGDENGMIKLTLVVGDRFNRSYTDSLARLSAKYIEDVMLMDWWRPINEKQSSLYAKFVERDLEAIKRCFNKTAPAAPLYKYPTSLNITGSTINIGVGEEHTVTYTISDGAIDDIEARIEDANICGTGRNSEGFTIYGRNSGNTNVLIYSRHNPELNRNIKVHVYNI
jgi:hypothetical protein